MELLEYTTKRLVDQRRMIDWTDEELLEYFAKQEYADEEMFRFEQQYARNTKDTLWMKKVIRRKFIDKHKAGILANNMNYRMNL